MVDLSIKIGSLTLDNPVMPASGTFADGLAQIVPFDRLGAMVTKTITAEVRGGNPTPRVAESVRCHPPATGRSSGLHLERSGGIFLHGPGAAPVRGAIPPAGRVHYGC